MRDEFLMSFTEGQPNYDGTIAWLMKHHPLCQEKGLSDDYKMELVSNMVNDALRKVIFKSVFCNPPSARSQYHVDIENMLVVSKLMSGSFLLSVIVR
jgi:hypothetical protein